MTLKLSGCYKGVFSSSLERKTNGTDLELRVDIDGAHPLFMISGDFYSNSGGAHKYLSSFRFERVRQENSKENEITVIGTNGKFDPSEASFEQIKIVISLRSTPLMAVVECIGGLRTESARVCKRKSKYLRSVKLQNDFEEGVVPFKSFDTKELFSQFPNRKNPLGVKEAYAKAGINLIISKKPQKPVAHPKRIPWQGSVWTDDDLHSAMTKHFGAAKNKPEWRVWLLSALKYEISDLKGIMIDHKEGSRRGCAVFHEAIGDSTTEEKKMLLYVYVHELGHCFNLTHPCDRVSTNSKMVSEKCGCGSVSWMNLPKRYYSSKKSYGEAAFWKAFDFSFSDSELMHLRHGFRNDIIFGGNKFDADPNQEEV